MGLPCSGHLCYHCGASLGTEMPNFCPFCGAKQVTKTESGNTQPETKKLCKKCNYINESYAVYCSKCGSDLRDLLME